MHFAAQAQHGQRARECWRVSTEFGPHTTLHGFALEGEQQLHARGIDGHNATDVHSDAWPASQRPGEHLMYFLDVFDFQTWFQVDLCTNGRRFALFYPCHFHCAQAAALLSPDTLEVTMCSISRTITSLFSRLASPETN